MLGRSKLNKIESKISENKVIKRNEIIDNSLKP